MHCCRRNSLSSRERKELKLNEASKRITNCTSTKYSDACKGYQQHNPNSHVMQVKESLEKQLDRANRVELQHRQRSLSQNPTKLVEVHLPCVWLRWHSVTHPALSAQAREHANLTKLKQRHLERVTENVFSTAMHARPAVIARDTEPFDHPAAAAERAVDEELASVSEPRSAMTIGELAGPAGVDHAWKSNPETAPGRKRKPGPRKSKLKLRVIGRINLVLASKTGV